MKKIKQSASAAKPAAALAGGAVGMFLIGLFQFLTEALPGIKPSLTVISGIGPLSGKVLIGYVLGLLAYFVAYQILKGKEADLTRYFYAFIAILIVASLLVFVPFTNIILGK